MKNRAMVQLRIVFCFTAGKQLYRLANSKLSDSISKIFQFNYRKLLLLSILCALCISSFSQAICGFDNFHQKLLKSDSAYASAIKANTEKIRNYIAAHTIPNQSSRIGTTLYTIPVVVHVMRPYASDVTHPINNPPNEQIVGAIAYLNQVFNGTYTGTLGAGDLQIQFELAQRTPNSICTNGIDRVDASSLPGYVTNGINSGNVDGCPKTTLKNYAKWNPNDYYNIWVVHKIDGNDGTSGVFEGGFAPFPGSDEDGLVILASQMFPNRRTLPHEMGHALYLYHTFEGSLDNTECQSIYFCDYTGDKVCDTDPITKNVSETGYDFTCRTGTNTCTGTPYNDNTEKNYMSYTECFNLFTNGQKARMQDAMTEDSRETLVRPDNLALVSPTGDCSCTNQFEPNNIYTSANPFFAGTLAAGSSDYAINANIGYLDDVDWYKVTLAALGNLTITLSNLPYDYNVELYGPGGSGTTVLAGSYLTGTQNDIINFQSTSASPTTYYIKIYSSYPPYFSSAYCYNLRIQWASASDIILTSGSLTTCGGNFYDDGGPNESYSPNQNSILTLHPSSSGAKLSVSFSYFQARIGDTLFVYNGSNPTPANLIGRLNGQAGYGTITSTAADGSLTFKFVSDGSFYPSVEAGWAATIACNYTPPEVTMLASGTFTKCSGNFYDGGGPNGPYMGVQNVITTLKPLDGSTDKLSVTFSSFQSRIGDTLFVYNGSNPTAANLIGRLSGEPGVGTIASTAPDGSLTFKFVSDASFYPSVEAGWVATIACNYTPPDVTMLASGTFTKCSGNFYDGGGPGGPYMGVQNVTTTIKPDNASDKLSVTFSSFQSRIGDTLFVYNGSNATPANLIGRLSGEPGIGTITSTAADGSLTFKFVSDASSYPSDEAGWVATIACNYTPADVTMLASGTFSKCSGNFYDCGGPDGPYMGVQNVTTTIKPENASDKLSVTFSSFQSRIGDTLFVYNGSNHTPANLIIKLNGEPSVGTFTSTAPDGCLTFKFVSDASFYPSVEAGWSAAISCTPVTTISSCQNGGNTFTSNLSGTSYQWQVNTGTGFVNISNNSNYSGVTTASLQLSNIPSSFYGYQYRCRVDGNNSSTFYLKIENSWTGSASIAWANPANWSCGAIPDNKTDVIINSGTNHPEVSSNISCRSLTVQPGATFIVKPGYKIDITGQ